MLIQRPPGVPASEITPQAVYEGRRAFLRQAGIGLAAAAAWSGGLRVRAEAAATLRFPALQKSPYSAAEKPNSFKEISSYNNFYEFGAEKTDPAQYAGSLRTRPWTLSIEGLVHKPRTLGIEDVLKLAPLEERIYRLRCVEAWSMVVPWVGFPLEKLLRQVEPLGSARFVEFWTLYRPDEMPGQRRGILDWPYIEGLRLDEARHPLTLMAVGLYGQALPNQNGAPLRLVVPWKYGFKSGKSIVKIRFVDTMPQSAWMKANPAEYGFYSNVNPNVDHPRWSQAKERRIGEFFKRETLMFNGYADQVGQLYTGMDLRRNF